MDIKSKSLRKIRGLKIMAVLLVLVLAGTFALSLGQVCDLSLDLGGESVGSLLNQTQGDFTGSSMFQQELIRNLYYMRQMAFVYQSEEAVRDGSALKAQEAILEQEKEKKLKEALEQARLEKEEEIKRQKQYETGYANEEETLETTTKAGEAPVTTKVTLTEEEKAEIEESITYDYNEKLRDLRIHFDANYRNAKEGLANLENLHYLLVNRETGALYTNLEGNIDPKTTDLRALVEQYKWNESYTKEYGYHTGEQVTRTFGQWVMWDEDRNFYIWAATYGDRMTLYEKTFVNNGWDVYLGLNDTITPGVDGFQEMQTQFEAAKKALPVYLILAGISLLLAAALTLYLIAACGHRAGTEEITLIWVDRIPNDLHLLLSGTLVVLGTIGSYMSMDSLWYSESFSRTLWLWAITALSMAATGVAIEWLTSVARNIKRRQFWRNTLIAKGWRRFKKALRHVREEIRKHTIPKHKMKNLRASILFLLIGYLLLNAILITITVFATRAGEPIFFFFFAVLTVLFNSFVLIFIWKNVIALDKIMTAVSKTRQGDLNYPLQTAGMPWLLRQFGEDVIGIQDGMRTAVDEAVKGEHMKTELITNVSHDLKTPLTAIINYVDLLKKCDISNETAQGYIGVLEEKSERLKHLIEDLVEASKATTGNLQLNFIKVNLYELAMQAVGESGDAMEAAGLDVRLNQPEKEPLLRADSQKTWRIIDNLISNVKKYAMPGTRVYMNVGEENGYGFFSIKNISKEPLDVPVEQLTQRFVRGDSSRSTEGSGLGLSIAQSLCELQQGTLEISLDGDLFKVTVRIPLDQTN